MDLIIVIALIIIILVWKKSFKDVVFLLAIVELFFRLSHYISNLIKIKEVSNIVKYIPTSLEALINYYSDGIFSNVLIICLLFCAISFEYYLIKMWFKKR